MSESGDLPKDWKLFLPDWLKRGREKVDLTNIPARKLQEAYRERRIEIDTTESEPDKRIATVNKVAVKGDGPLVPPS